MKDQNNQVKGQQQGFGQKTPQNQGGGQKQYQGGIAGQKNPQQNQTNLGQKKTGQDINKNK